MEHLNSFKTEDEQNQQPEFVLDLSLTAWTDANHWLAELGALVERSEV